MSDIKLYHGDCLEIMKTIPDKSIDMCLTFPLYDNLRKYGEYHFDFEQTAIEIFRS
jgi:DNA modification methylase